MSSPSSREARGESVRCLLFHVHTRYSFDSWLSPRRIIASARAAGLDAVVVTDHDTHLGSLTCARLAAERGPLFPAAAEYKSTAGDMISVFLTKAITTREPLGIIEETHAQGGLVVLPHPFKNARFADAVFEQCDLIETFNARTSDTDNARAEEAARSLGKPTIAGADAHLARELGFVINEFDVPPDWPWKRVLLTGSRSAVTTKTTLRNLRLSQMIKSCRSVQPIRFANHAARWLLASASDQP